MDKEIARIIAYIAVFAMIGVIELMGTIASFSPQ